MSLLEELVFRCDHCTNVLATRTRDIELAHAVMNSAGWSAYVYKVHVVRHRCETCTTNAKEKE